MFKKDYAHFKYLTFLSMFYITVLLASTLLDYKFISIGPMLASSATFIISLTFFLSDIIAEVYGYRKARQVVFSGVICLLLFSLISFLLKDLETPLAYEKYGDAYNVILGLLFRAGVANAIAITIGALFNIYFVSKWKALVKGKYFWLRSLGSSAIGEALYTIFVVTLLNAGLVPFKHLLQILVISYSFKLLFDLLAVVPASLLASFLKRTEKVDVYDFPNNLTPFKYLTQS